MSLDLEATVRKICKALNVEPVEATDAANETVLDISKVYGVKLARVEALRPTLPAYKQAQLPKYFVCKDSVTLAKSDLDKQLVEMQLGNARTTLGITGPITPEYWLPTANIYERNWMGTYVVVDGLPDHAVLPEVLIEDVYAAVLKHMAGIPEPVEFPKGK